MKVKCWVGNTLVPPPLPPLLPPSLASYVPDGEMVRSAEKGIDDRAGQGTEEAVDGGELGEDRVAHAFDREGRGRVYGWCGWSM